MKWLQWWWWGHSWTNSKHQWWGGMANITDWDYRWPLIRFGSGSSLFTSAYWQHPSTASLTIIWAEGHFVTEAIKNQHVCWYIWPNKSNNVEMLVLMALVELVISRTKVSEVEWYWNWRLEIWWWTQNSRSIFWNMEYWCQIFCSWGKFLSFEREYYFGKAWSNLEKLVLRA